MPRKPRRAFPGARYHVTARGIRRQPIFFDPKDYQRFLCMLARSTVTCQVELYSYCLMYNHIHLYLQTPRANISRFMHGLLTTYAVVLTRQRDLPGHLFQNRFWSELVEDGQAGQRVSRYIHLNPCKGKGLDDLPLEARLRILRAYPWSSYRATIGLEACPRWLERQELLRPWGRGMREQELGYCAFVERGLGLEDEPIPEHEGSQEPCASGLPGAVLPQAPGTASILQVNQEAPVRIERLMDAVAAVFGVQTSDLMRPWGRFKGARKALAFLAVLECRGARPIAALARDLGISLTALQTASSRVRRELPAAPEYREKLKEVLQLLGREAQDVFPFDG